MSKHKLRLRELPELFPGDIFATSGRGPLGWASEHLFTPRTNMYHHGLIVRAGRNENGEIDDYEILESIDKGLAVGWLSMYEGKNVSVYRVNVDGQKHLGEEAVESMIKYGRYEYDFMLYYRLIPECILLPLRGQLPPWRADQLTYPQDGKVFICTAAAAKAWANVGVDIIKPGVIPLPSEFKRAEENKLIYQVYPKVCNGRRKKCKKLASCSVIV